MIEPSPPAPTERTPSTYYITISVVKTINKKVAFKRLQQAALLQVLGVVCIHTPNGNSTYLAFGRIQTASNKRGRFGCIHPCPRVASRTGVVAATARSNCDMAYFHEFPRRLPLAPDVEAIHRCHCILSASPQEQ